jgi:hypothetical protein
MIRFTDVQKEAPQMARPYRCDDDDAFDERGILRDGRSVRV